jgi:predicted negative regulator of RcsB-dependent stress response
MVRLDLEEQEQFSKLKYFWQDYGKYIVGIIVVAIIAYSSSSLWSLHVKKQSQQAAVLYADLDTAITTNNKDEVFAITNKLEHNFTDTKYAVLASLWAASVAFTGGQLDLSINYLKWVIDHAKDRGFSSIARLRLANIYIDKKLYPQALELMMAKPRHGFEPLYYAKRGDIYLVQGNKDKAIGAYQEALRMVSKDSPIAQSVNSKLQLLGIVN